jgi:transposase
MLGSQDRWQEELFQVGSLAELVPEDHVLRRVDRVLDLSWVRGEVEALYSDSMGRPSIDPEAAIRLMLAGFFAGITHDRRLMREAQVNLAMRWFAGYRLHEALPDHSSLTRLRQRWGLELFTTLFERVVAQCAAAGLVEGEVWHVDATLIRADADCRRVARAHAARVMADNESQDEGPQPPPSAGRGPDTDATLAQSCAKALPVPSYKQHQVVDAKSGVIVEVSVTTGRVAESSQIVAQVEGAAVRLGQVPRAVTADSGYASGANFKALAVRGIQAVITTRPEKTTARRVPQRRFAYDAKNDLVRCPRGKKLRRAAAHRGGWNYRSKARDCARCDLKVRCVDSAAGRRTIKLVEGHPDLLRARRRHAARLSEDLALYARHRWRIEGRHAEAKRWHGLGRAVRRSLTQVAIQCRLTATVLNLKRLIGALAQNARCLKARRTLRPAFTF